MKKETIHEHASRIYELSNAISELARCEEKKVTDYTAEELVSTADNLLDIMGDWDDHEDRRRLATERRLLQNFIKKWGA